jgi:hypothetical protein
MKKFFLFGGGFLLGCAFVLGLIALAGNVLSEAGHLRVSRGKHVTSAVLVTGCNKADTFAAHTAITTVSAYADVLLSAKVSDDVRYLSLRALLFGVSETAKYIELSILLYLMQSPELEDQDTEKKQPSYQLPKTRV